ncbi:hypothetical protein FRC14_000903 [Serendipita sp. 396]|nr:hypothetical protein FRC14_000903 [Serendipita sp. 396]KAG8773886.1 hypothetical protein FRC15_001708 [Serendipita sp. 397]KAG8790106.1 hypothetical protein FRC16_001030 [Serendipita sp. 398]KAG8828470.1 hypothetical protein FRC19_003809 [Serendipita sp. 401]KAG8856687.1 hypothetical protein FRC20_000426 [Serendipita sp. 405]KAG9058114.1 hypothetical protein FS842_001298 [Serendipita sp. 407]
MRPALFLLSLLSLLTAFAVHGAPLPLPAGALSPPKDVKDVSSTSQTAVNGCPETYEIDESVKNAGLNQKLVKAWLAKIALGFLNDWCHHSSAELGVGVLGPNLWGTVDVANGRHKAFYTNKLEEFKLTLQT